MSIKEQIINDLKDAMRAQDKAKVSALRLITAAIKQIEVDERIEVDETRLIVILSKLLKQRHESITQFQAASRNDLVKQEQYEIDIIQKYLPQPLPQEQLNEIIEKALSSVEAKSMADMGKVMAIIKPKLQGRADMAKVSSIIKDKLTNTP